MLTGDGWAVGSASPEQLVKVAGDRITTVPIKGTALDPAQLRASDKSGTGPNQALLRHPILRERFADVLTDALRAALLRLHGYRVDVVEFVDSAHTPRNVLLRARRTGVAPTEGQRAEYADLILQWGVTPRLATLLATSGTDNGQHT